MYNTTYDGSTIEHSSTKPWVDVHDGPNGCHATMHTTCQNAPQRQTPLHLPFLPSVSQSHPLPSIPTTVCIESQNPIFSSQNIENRHFPSHNNENHPFPSHNNENCQFLPTNQTFYSWNNQYRPVYDTQPFSSTYANLPTGPPLYHSNQNNINTTQCLQHNILSPTPLSFLPYPSIPNLPTIKEPSTPSSPTYIPILTGRLDWCPWSEALMVAVFGMNLFGHLAEDYNPQWGYDPGSIPTYPLAITLNSSPEELQAWTLWWIQDGQVLHLLVSLLSASAHAQLPGAGSARHQRQTAWSLYKELVRLFAGTDYQTLGVIHDELVALRCAPSCILDYVAHWHTGLNKLASAGYPSNTVDSIWHFVNHLLYGPTFDIIQESVRLLLVLQGPDQLPSFESVVKWVTNIDQNRSFYHSTCSCYSNVKPATNTTPTATATSSKDTPTSTTTTNTSQPACPPQSASFCTNCCQTGHMLETCFKSGGGQQGGLTAVLYPPPWLLADSDRLQLECWNSIWNPSGIPFQQIPSSFCRIPRAIPTHSKFILLDSNPFQPIPAHSMGHSNTFQVEFYSNGFQVPSKCHVI